MSWEPKKFKEGSNSQFEAWEVSWGQVVLMSPWSASFPRSGMNNNHPDRLRWGWIEEIQSASLSLKRHLQALQVGRAQLAMNWEPESDMN